MGVPYDATVHRPGAAPLPPCSRLRRGERPADGEARAGRAVVRAAGAHRAGAPGRRRTRADSGRRRRRCPQGPRRVGAGGWLSRQGGWCADDAQRDLSDRVHDQADRHGGGSFAVRRGPTAAIRSRVEIHSRVQEPDGRPRAGPRRARDDDPGPDAAHLRADVRQPGQDGDLQNVPGVLQRLLVDPDDG